MNPKVKKFLTFNRFYSIFSSNNNIHLQAVNNKKKKKNIQHKKWSNRKNRSLMPSKNFLNLIKKFRNLFEFNFSAANFPRTWIRWKASTPMSYSIPMTRLMEKSFSTLTARLWSTTWTCWIQFRITLPCWPFIHRRTCRSCRRSTTCRTISGTSTWS